MIKAAQKYATLADLIALIETPPDNPISITPLEIDFVSAHFDKKGGSHV